MCAEESMKHTLWVPLLGAAALTLSFNAQASAKAKSQSAKGAASSRSFPATDYEQYYAALPAELKSVIPPSGHVKDVVVPEKVVSIAEYANLVEKTYFKDFDGAEYTALWTKAIQKAIDELSGAGGGHLVFPAGTYLSGPIVMKSNVDLHLEKGAALLASPNKTLYLAAGAHSYLIYASNLDFIERSNLGYSILLYKKF